MDTGLRDAPRASGDDLVGRAAELAVLKAAAERARSDIANVVIIAGPAGIGKTALINSFLSQTRDLVVFRATATRSELALPYALVDQLLAAIPGGEDALDRSVQQSTISPFAMGVQLVEEIGQLRSPKPVALVLDNMHWADPESVNALRFMARRLYRESVLIVAIGRDHHGDWDAADGAAWPTDTDRLTLRGLSGAEVQTLASISNRGLSQWTLRRLHQQTDGNPLYLRSVLADPDASQSYLFGRSRMPQSLAAVVNHTLASATDPQRELLAALTITGDLTLKRTLTALTHLEDIDTLLGPLVDSGVVEWRFDHGEERLAFCSIIYRDAMYAHLDGSKRQQLHRAAAEISIGASRWGHLVAATDDDPALADQLAGLAQDEATRDSPVSASTYLLWAARITAEPQQSGHYLIEAVRLLVYAGREGQALEYAAMIGRLPHSARRTEVLGLLAFARGHAALARDLLVDARHQVLGDDPELLAGINVELAYVYLLLGLGRGAVTAALEGLTAAQMPSQVCAARAFLAAGTALRSGALAGLAVLGELPAEPIDCPMQQLAPLTQRGLLRGLLGRLDLAVADLTVVVARRDSSYSHLLGVSAHIHLIWCKYLQGNWDAAERTLTVAFDAAEQYGRSLDHAVLHSLSAILHAGRGEEELAEADLGQATRLAATADYLGPTVHLNLARAAIAQAAGQPAKVIAALTELTPLSLESDRVQLYSVWWLPPLCDAQITIGQLSQAEGTLNAFRAAEADGSCWKVPAARLGARLQEARGDLVGARSGYEAAIALPTEGAQSDLHGAQLYHDYGTFLARVGERKPGLAALALAANIFARLGAAPSADRCAADIGRIDSTATVNDTWMKLLTDRERETANLVGRGWTTREIATELFVSAKTTEYHLRNIYMKLNITGRRELRNIVQHDRTS